MIQLENEGYMRYFVSCETLMIYVHVIDMGSWIPQENVFGPDLPDIPNKGYMPPIGWDWDL